MPTTKVYNGGVLTDIFPSDSLGNPLKPKWQRRALPCIHLGDETGEKKDCAVCGGKKQIPLRKCGIYGSCSNESRLIYREESKNIEVPWCKTCKDYESEEGKDLLGIELVESRLILGGTTNTYANCTQCCGAAGGTACTAVAFLGPGEGFPPVVVPYSAIGGVWWGTFTSGIGDLYTAATSDPSVTITVYHGSSCDALTFTATGTGSVDFGIGIGSTQWWIELSGTVTVGNLTVTNNTPP